MTSAERNCWPDCRYLELVGIDIPIVQAPMAGANLSDLAIAVSQAGGLGSLPCGMLSVDKVRSEFATIRQQTARPVNANFFCHGMPTPVAADLAHWREILAPYYAEYGIRPGGFTDGASRLPFDAIMYELALELKPRVVSFHYGLPDDRLVDGLKKAGCVIQSTATTVAEARWLEDNGADAIVAQGLEAGGHRGMFLDDDITTQMGTLALVPQIVDAVRVPVVASGGIADARGIAAVLALGASAVQIGTGYLLCPESTISTVYRQALRDAAERGTVLTNVMSGRPARGIYNRLIRDIGPIGASVPAFPLASGALQPLRENAELRGSDDFSPLWAGQAAALCQPMDAAEVTKALATDTLRLLHRLAGR